MKKDISKLPIHKQIALGRSPKVYKGMQGTITKAKTKTK